MAMKISQPTWVIPVETSMCPCWGEKHRLLGWYVGIFGPSKGNRNRTYFLPAIQCKDTAQPTVYSDETQAMDAWRRAVPIEMSETVANQHYIPPYVRERINELQLYRQLPG